MANPSEKAETLIDVESDLDALVARFNVFVATTLEAAQGGRLLGPGLEKDTRVGGRVPHQLLDAAKARSGITSTTALLEYALAKVAIEDDFGQFLVSQAGTVDPDLDLEF